MSKVKFLLEKQAGTNLIQYPDDQTLFSNSLIGRDGYIYADYSGSLPLEDGSPTYNSQTGEDKETKISVLSFLSRFTDEAAIAIDLASIDDPTATLEARTLSATIRRFLSKVNAASHIDLSRQDTIDGVNGLVGLGFLTSERAASILTDPIIELEEI